jgi:hypothetical protein
MLRESEKYVDLTVAGAIGSTQTSLNPPQATDAATRATKLMPNALNNQTDVKTAIMPGAFSQETAIKASNGDTQRTAAIFQTETSGNSKVARRRATFAAALAGLVLAGTAASAAYLMKPEIFGVDSVDSKTPEVQTFVANSAAVNAETKSADSISGNHVVNVETPSNVLANPESVKRETKSSGDTAVKNSKNKAKNNKSSASGSNQEDDPAKVEIDGETVIVGGMKITENGIETPHAIIDDNGVRRKNGSKQPLSPEEIRGLMELQKKRMRILMKKKLPVPPQSPPAPDATPDQ